MRIDKMKIGWTTTATYAEAETLARQAVEQGLALTAQVEGALQTFFMENDELQNSDLYRVTFQFPAADIEQLEEWLQTNHPADTPQWLTFTVKQNFSEDLNEPSWNEYSDPGKIIELSRHGAELLKKHQYVEAEKVFLEALEKDSKNPYILVGLGDLCRETRSFSKSLNYYQRTLDEDPTNTFALRGIGDVYRGLNKPAKSIPYWLEYLKHKNDDIHVITRLADSYVKSGNFDKSEKLYRQALALNENDKYALRGIGSLFYKKGKLEEALTFFEKFLALDDRYIAVLTMTGNICRRRKEYERAAHYYKKCLKLEPNNTFALYGMGDAQRGMHNYQEAIASWEKIIAREPRNQSLLSRVGDALVLLGKTDEAIDHYKRSLAVGFETFALLGLSRLYRGQQNFAEAENYCRKIIERYPDDIRGLEEMENIRQEMARQG
jgi:tetratricopeptide (TPR) repeat protein